MQISNGKNYGNDSGEEYGGNDSGGEKKLKRQKPSIFILLEAHILLLLQLNNHTSKK